MSLHSIDRAVERLLKEPKIERGALAARLRRLAAQVDEPLRAAKRSKARATHRADFERTEPMSSEKETRDNEVAPPKTAEIHDGQHLWDWRAQC